MITFEIVVFSLFVLVAFVRSVLKAMKSGPNGQESVRNETLNLREKENNSPVLSNFLKSNQKSQVSILDPFPNKPQLSIAEVKAHNQIKPYNLGLNMEGLERNKNVVVPSFSDSKKSYTVNLNEMTCTCASFSKQMHLPSSLLSRCCKHILHVLFLNGALKSTDSWMFAIRDSANHLPDRAWLIDLESASPVLVTAEAGNEWINVLAHTVRSKERIKTASGPIERFGWNISEKRWSYGSGPPGSHELTPLMKLFFN